MNDKIQKYFNCIAEANSNNEVIKIAVKQNDLIKEISDLAENTDLYKSEKNKELQKEFLDDFKIDNKYKKTKDKLLFLISSLAIRICQTSNSILQRGAIICFMPLIYFYLEKYIKHLTFYKKTIKVNYKNDQK